jgi:hypothetical protein
MRSVADSLRADTLAADARRAADQRLEIALRLGDADVSLLATARAMSDAEARRHIARQRQHGRRPSGCHQRLLA